MGGKSGDGGVHMSAIILLKEEVQRTALSLQLQGHNRGHTLPHAKFAGTLILDFQVSLNKDLGLFTLSSLRHFLAASQTDRNNLSSVGILPSDPQLILHPL